MENNKIYSFTLTSEKLKEKLEHIPDLFNDPICGAVLIKGILIGACGYEYAEDGFNVEKLGETFIFTTLTTPTRFDRFKKVFVALFGFELKYSEEEIKNG